MAQKFKDLEKLGSFRNGNDKDQATSVFADRLNFGKEGQSGLTYPTQDFLQDVVLMKCLFDSFHGEESPYAEGVGVTVCFLEVLVKNFPHIPPQILDFASRLFTYIRIRHVNLEEKASKIKKEESKGRETPSPTKAKRNFVNIQ